MTQQTKQTKSTDGEIAARGTITTKICRIHLFMFRLFDGQRCDHVYVYIIVHICCVRSHMVFPRWVKVNWSVLPKNSQRLVSWEEEEEGGKRNDSDWNWCTRFSCIFYFNLTFSIHSLRLISFIGYVVIGFQNFSFPLFAQLRISSLALAANVQKKHRLKMSEENVFYPSNAFAALHLTEVITMYM